MAVDNKRRAVIIRRPFPPKYLAARVALPNHFFFNARVGDNSCPAVQHQLQRRPGENSPQRLVMVAQREKPPWGV